MPCYVEARTRDADTMTSEVPGGWVDFMSSAAVRFTGLEMCRSRRGEVV